MCRRHRRGFGLADVGNLQIGLSHPGAVRIQAQAQRTKRQLHLLDSVAAAHGRCRLEPGSDRDLCLALPVQGLHEELEGFLGGKGHLHAADFSKGRGPSCRRRLFADST